MIPHLSEPLCNMYVLSIASSTYETVNQSAATTRLAPLSQLVS